NEIEVDPGACRHDGRHASLAATIFHRRGRKVMTLEARNPFTARARIAALTLTVGAAPLPAMAEAFSFSTGSPDGLMATASRPDAGGQSEIEPGDDFLLGQATSITSATFTGLLTGRGSVGDIGNVVVEIYRVFPLDSNTNRTPNVPTRANSPSDVAFDSRD